MTSDTIKGMCTKLRRGDKSAMNRVQRELDKETGVLTCPLLNVKFLSKHVVADSPFRGLFDIMADCVKTAVKKRLSAAIYPIERAADGTLVMPPENLVFKTTDNLDIESNWGSTRLGVGVFCAQKEPLGFQVMVGPFFELKRMAEKALKDMGHDA